MKLPVNSMQKGIKTLTEPLSKGLKVMDTTLSRELEMVPKYLELAQNPDGYRFNPEQIKGLTKSFKTYETTLSKTDLVKELLAIGAEKGEPLSAKEIAGFLKSTSSMEQLEQRNVLQFLKAAKEKEILKYTPESVRKIFPYEEFKANEIRINQGTTWLKHNSDYLDEVNIRTRYEIALENELRIGQNKYYNEARKTNQCHPSEYITSGRYPEFVKAVAKSNDPKNLESVIEITGINPTIINAVNELTEAFKISGNNKGLVLDLSRGFYPSEIKQIVSILSTEVKAGIRKDLHQYTANTYKEYHVDMPHGINLSTQRKNVLKDLGLTGKISLRQLSYYMDVYPNTFFTNNMRRGSLFTKGSYEQGKRK